MRTGLILVAAALVLVAGTLLGIAAIFLVPIVGAIALVGFIALLLVRKAEHKPPIR